MRSVKDFRALERYAERLEAQANSTLDEKRRAQLRSLARDLKRQAEQAKRVRC